MVLHYYKIGQIMTTLFISKQKIFQILMLKEGKTFSYSDFILTNAQIQLKQKKYTVIKALKDMLAKPLMMEQQPLYTNQDIQEPLKKTAGKYLMTIL